MDSWPRKISLWRKPRFVPLRYRLIFLTSGLVTLLLVTIALAVSHQQSRTIKNQVERRGLAIAQSIAASSKSALTTYTYITLSQTANQAAQDPDVAYVIIHDKEGRVAGYSGRPDLEWKFLDDDASHRAISAKEPLVQNAFLEANRMPIVEIAVPVSIPGSERTWGIVRVAISLLPMYRQIQQVQALIVGIGILALVFSILGCIWLARRITNPVGLLVDATIVAAQGNLDQDIHISTGDEVEVLANNFSIMIREILLQRRQLEHQLSEITALQRYLNKLLSTMNDGLLSIDMEGKLVTINPAASAMLGIQSMEAPLNICDAIGEAPELLRYLQGALANPSSARQEELQVLLGGETRNVIVASSLLTDKTDKPQQIILNLHDVTLLKRLESRFRQAERLAALGTLSAGMAHEIRNPLSAIKTFVQLLPRKLEKPGFLEKFQRTVPRELDRINRLVEDLLELAREPKYQFSLVDVTQILQQAIELFDEELIQRGIKGHFDIPREAPLIWANTDQLTKAFNNIIHNAIQAMPSGGDLCIQTLAGTQPAEGTVSRGNGEDAQNCWLSLAFSDTGIGMSTEDVKSIFNPFFTTKDSGTGLGLSITHKVITEHGGQIEVFSTPGKGTRFIIHLPVQESSNLGHGTAFVGH
ncbi:MAG: ATP-binding protein [Syntrophobacteraceae bacterium]